MKRNICCYGSLRKNHGNWRYILSESPQLSTEVVNIPFKMISMGGFPGLVPSPENHDITIEIFEVDEPTYQRVENLEGYPNFYQKALIPTSLGELEIYVLMGARYQSGYDVVENGDWNTHLKPYYAES